MPGTGATEAAGGPTIRLTDDVEWIRESYPIGGGRFVHVNVYLIRAGGKNIVVDSGSFYHRESIREKITRATAGQGIDALILSHSDYPHSGNIAAFRREWGDFEIVASCGDAAIQGLPYATTVHIGGTQEVLGRVFDFLDPPLADRSHTSWIYDRASGVVFAADGFGYHHREKETGLVSTDLPGGFRLEDVYGFHRDTLVWLRYVDPPKLMQTLRRMLDVRPVSFVAPIHGNPIAAGDLPAYLDLLEESLERIVAEYAVGGVNGAAGQMVGG